MRRNVQERLGYDVREPAAVSEQIETALDEQVVRFGSFFAGGRVFFGEGRKLFFAELISPRGIADDERIIPALSVRERVAADDRTPQGVGFERRVVQIQVDARNRYAYLVYVDPVQRRRGKPGGSIAGPRHLRDERERPAASRHFAPGR